MNKQRIKVAFFGDDFSRRGKGTAIVIQQITDEFVKNFSDRVEVIALRKDNPCTALVCSRIRHMLIRHYRLPFFSTLISYLIFFLRCQEEFDVVVFNRRLYPGFWLLRARCFVLIAYNAPFSEIHKDRLTWANWCFENFIRYIGKRFLDAIVAVSYDAQKNIAAYYRVSQTMVKVIYGGVSENFGPMNGEQKEYALELLQKKYGITAPYILDVSKLDPHRNVAALIESFALLPASHKLVVVGTSHTRSYANYVQDCIKKFHLEARVSIISFVEESDMPALYACADILVFPSLMEGFGLPLVEAMKSGIPVVTSNISSMPEVIGDAGVLVDPQNPKSIAEGIMNIFNNGYLRAQLIARGKRRAKMFSWQKAAEEYLKLYDYCLYR